MHVVFKIIIGLLIQLIKTVRHFSKANSIFPEIEVEHTLHRSPSQTRRGTKRPLDVFVKCMRLLVIS